MNDVINYQFKLLENFNEKYKKMLLSLKKINNSKHITTNITIINDKIDYLSKFNNDLQVTMNELDILNDVLSSDTLDDNVQNKLKEYNNMNNTIKELLPYLIIKTCL